MQGYFNNYAVVARIVSIRVLIALATIYKFEIYQMDVNCTDCLLEWWTWKEKLHGRTKRFIMHGQEHKVCTLVKSF